MSSYDDTFIWYELNAKDVDRAKDFYARAIGWTARENGAGDMRYVVLGDVAGVLSIPVPTGWMGYIAVDDVDGMAKRVTSKGGTIHREPTDIPGIGRFCVVADPQGGGFVLFKPIPPSEMPRRPGPGEPGAFGWHELHAREWEAVWPFYAELFGWQKHAAIDMGPMGTYQTFGKGEAFGGMMTGRDHFGWIFITHVDDIDAASARIVDAGGKALHEPHQVPGGGWVVNATDPDGSRFAIIGPKLSR